MARCRQCPRCGAWKPHASRFEAGLKAFSDGLMKLGCLIMLLPVLLLLVAILWAMATGGG